MKLAVLIYSLVSSVCATLLVNPFAGNGVEDFAGDDGPATSASMVAPCGVCFNPSGVLFISDKYDNRIRKVGIDGVISTAAGSGNYSADSFEGPATSASFKPQGVCGDSTGVIYITDESAYFVRKLGLDGILSVYGGNGKDGGYGISDGGQATSTDLHPVYCYVHPISGDLYLSVANDFIVRKISSATRIISRVAGTDSGVDPAAVSYSSGKATSFSINLPLSIFIDSTGHMFISEYEGLRVFKMDLSSTAISTIAGKFDIDYPTGDGGPSTSATFDSEELFLTGNPVTGDLYISQYEYIRKIDGISNVIDTPIGSINGTGYAGDFGPAADAEFDFIRQMAMFDQKLYIADFYNSVVRVVSETSGTPSVVPSATPSVVPSAIMSATPSLVPSLTPSGTPSQIPTALPSMVPSPQPSAAPSVAPSEVPSVVPSVVPSETPSLGPSATPSVVPSAGPSQEPSAKPSKIPSLKPSVRPTRVPTGKPSFKPSAAPTVTFSGVAITTNLTVENVHREQGSDNRRLTEAGSMLLLELSDNAIISAVAVTLDLSEEAVSIENETPLSEVAGVSTVLVALKILVPRGGFPSYESCFVHYKGVLDTAIESDALLEGLVMIAEETGAYELYQITAVNVTSVVNVAAINTEVSDKDGDDLSTGYFAGVVIGVVLSFLLLATAMLFIFNRARDEGARQQSAAPAAMESKV